MRSILQPAARLENRVVLLRCASALRHLDAFVLGALLEVLLVLLVVRGLLGLGLGLGDLANADGLCLDLLFGNGLHVGRTRLATRRRRVGTHARHLGARRLGCRLVGKDNRRLDVADLLAAPASGRRVMLLPLDQAHQRHVRVNVRIDIGGDAVPVGVAER